VAGEARTAIEDATASAPPDPAVVARRAVEAFLAVVIDDPRKGRILLLESLTEPTLGRRGLELQPLFADLIRAHLASPGDPEAELTATALIGALANLFRRWLDGDLPADRGDMTDYVVQLLLILSTPRPVAAGGAG
jgi:AcrR family transcriptional regulator